MKKKKQSKNQSKNQKRIVNKNKVKLLNYLITVSIFFILVSGGLVYQQSKKDKLNTFAKEIETVETVKVATEKEPKNKSKANPSKEVYEKQQENQEEKQENTADENKEIVKKAIHQKLNEITHSESTEDDTFEYKTNDQENTPNLNQTETQDEKDEVVIPQEENTYSDGGVNFFGEYFPLLYMPKIIQEEGEPPIYIPADQYVRYHTLQKDHLMIEHVTRQSELLRQMSVGDTFYYNGRKYQITQAHRYAPNDPYQAGNVVELTLYYDNADFENITLHTCETMQFNSPQGLWVAQPL